VIVRGFFFCGRRVQWRAHFLRFCVSFSGHLQLVTVGPVGHPFFVNGFLSPHLTCLYLLAVGSLDHDRRLLDVPDNPNPAPSPFVKGPFLSPYTAGFLRRGHRTFDSALSGASSLNTFDLLVGLQVTPGVVQKEPGNSSG